MRTDLRFNKQVFWPDWADERIEQIIPSIDMENIVWSPHLEEKMEKAKKAGSRSLLSRNRREVLRYLRQPPELDLGNVFEFYLRRKDLTIKKICHRAKLPDTKYDVVLVVAVEGILVTVYLNKSNYVHRNLDENLYIKGRNK